MNIKRFFYIAVGCLAVVMIAALIIQMNDIDKPIESTPSSTAGASESVFVVEDIDILPQAELTAEKHLSVLLGCGALANSWASPDELNPNAIVDYYTALGVVDERLPDIKMSYPKEPKHGDLLMPAKYVEQVGSLYFGVSADMLRKSSYYYEEQDGYILYGLGSVASCTVTEEANAADSMVIKFDMLWNGAPYAVGSLVIDTDDDGSWQYRSLDLDKQGG